MLEQQIEVLETAPSPKHASLVAILETILTTPDMPLPGISVLEVLNAIFTRLIQTLQHGDFSIEKPEQEEGPPLWAYMIHHGLVHSVGGLASQTYYHNQLDDMTGYLVAKLRASTSLSTVDGLPIALYRHATLRCLNKIVDVLGDTSPTIAASCWTGALALLTDVSGECKTLSAADFFFFRPSAHAFHLETRIDFANALVHYLTRSAPPTKETLFPQTGDIVFLNTLHHTVLAWVQRPDFDANDTRALHAVLCASLRRFGREAVIRATPLVFKIQDLARNQVIQPAPRQRAVAAALVLWIGAVSDFYDLDALQLYAQRIQDERREKQQWTPLAFSKDDTTPSFDDAPQTVTVWMDRHEVVQPLSVALRDSAEDPHGLDVESKLYVEWGSEAFISHERAPRIAPEHHEHKPRLARPSPRLEMESKKDSSIKVQNLKQALVGSDENDPPQPQRNGSLNRRASQLRTDVSALLTELNADARAHSTHSLVHPPYQ